MVLTNSKRCDSKSNDKVEKAILEWHIRTLKLLTEDRIGNVPPDHLVIYWMVEYAAEVINRFRVISNKMIPREIIRGQHASSTMAEFGENELLLPETWEGGRIEKHELKFERGVCLGVCPRTDEAIIGTPARIARAGTVKRQVIEVAWKASSLLSISTTLWTAGRQSKRHEFTAENDEEEKLIKVDES